jgi:enoyl-CoA hydratase/carnithine racemase
MLQDRIEDGIIIATFANAPMNTITRDTVKDLKRIVDMANTDDSVKGIVFTGAGKTFSAGFDLPMFLGFKDLKEVVTFFEEVEQIYIDLFMCKKPVVAAINGAAVAGGLITAMACDYRIAKNHPKIMLGMTEIKIGLGLSVVQTEIMRWGFDSDRLFRDIMYFGQMFNVARAKELNVIDEVAEEAELMDRAKKVVTSWIDNPGRAFIMLKESQRRPTAELMKRRLRDENWQEGFNCFFKPDTRKALEMVMAMMAK